jgi:type III restriction enzyme
VVLAKQEFARQMAMASGMTYRMIKGSDAKAGNYEVLLGSDEAAAKQYGLPV